MALQRKKNIICHNYEFRAPIQVIQHHTFAGEFESSIHQVPGGLSSLRRWPQRLHADQSWLATLWHCLLHLLGWRETCWLTGAERSHKISANFAQHPAHKPVAIRRECQSPHRPNSRPGGCKNPKEHWPRIIQEPESPMEKCETKNIKAKKQLESFSKHTLQNVNLRSACAVKVDLDVPHDAMRKPCPTYGVQVWSLQLTTGDNMGGS